MVWYLNFANNYIQIHVIAHKYMGLIRNTLLFPPTGRNENIAESFRRS